MTSTILIVHSDLLRQALRKHVHDRVVVVGPGSNVCGLRADGIVFIDYAEAWQLESASWSAKYIAWFRDACARLAPSCAGNILGAPAWLLAEVRR